MRCKGGASFDSIPLRSTYARLAVEACVCVSSGNRAGFVNSDAVHFENPTPLRSTYAALAVDDEVRTRATASRDRQDTFRGIDAILGEGRLLVEYLTRERYIHLLPLKRGLMQMTFADYNGSELPPAVLAYLDARDANRTAEATALFTPTATVFDDGGCHRGIDAIADWIAHTSTEFTYTSTRIGQRFLDEDRVVVQVRLEGDFPGGVVVLRYQFVVEDGLIHDLVIEV